MIFRHPGRKQETPASGDYHFRIDFGFCGRLSPRDTGNGPRVLPLHFPLRAAHCSDVTPAEVSPTLPHRLMGFGFTRYIIIYYTVALIYVTEPHLLK